MTSIPAAATAPTVPLTAPRALLTGAGGTVGQALEAELLAAGWQVTRWDRRAVPIDDYARMEEFVRGTGAHVLFHLAIASQPTGRQGEGWAVNFEWTSELAWICRVLELRFVFLSTAMVFSDAAIGPFTIDSVPDAREGYGYEKRMAEERVAYQNPYAQVVRLGWQLGERGDNTMQRFLIRQHAEHQQIRASTRWLPACSFIEDTAAALRRLTAAPPGLYMLDSNERWTFYDIARALLAGSAAGASWKVVPTEDFVYDQRLRDPRAGMPPLNVRLPSLP
jgi:dTDP-4-dehydrorhamnose reductase